MDVAAADFHDEAVQAMEGHRTVHVEEIDGKHRRGLRVQELPPGGVGMPFGCRGDLEGLEYPADRGCADPVAELEQFTLDPFVPQAWFSVASRSISAVIPALAGGRPVRFG
jgi:hypothetical protein